MSCPYNDWSWKPSKDVRDAIKRGNELIRRALARRAQEPKR